MRNNETEFITFYNEKNNIQEKCEYDKNTIRLPRQYLEKSRKASKINGFTEQEGAYYTTATPFLKAP